MNYVKTGLLLAILTLLLVWVGGVLGGPRGAMIALIFALVLNGVSYWYSDKIVLALYKAKEIPENQFYHLYNLVKGLSQSAGLPMPRIYMVEQKSPNAFATGRNPQKAVVCVTKGLLELLDEDELKGVLAHELAHVKNRDTLIMTVTAAIAGAIMMLAHMARWAAIFGGYSRNRRDSGNLFSLLAISILAPVAALIVQLAISRSREYAADRRGAYFAKNPMGLANALRRLQQAQRIHPMQASPQTAHLFIVNPFRASFIANLFSTHPPVEERIRRLQSISSPRRGEG
ncbi:MAG: zinc metalloprotease HtpX [Candidatus Omnitrophota bacterium]|nr:MAG: zinc metalloprotease HtpX [Candidatus Omnitrophota bacterium]